MIFFTSDLHMSHTNLILSNEKHGYRRSFFESVEDMNNTIITNWNNVVGEEDSVFILGDFTLRGPTHANELLNKLKGYKLLVRGNHDGFAEKKSFSNDKVIMNENYYEERIFRPELDKEIHICMSHFPFLYWNNMSNGSIHLHGHIHSTGRYNKENQINQLRRYDVGVEANNFTPISFDDLMKWLPPFKFIDYHGD